MIFSLSYRRLAIAFALLWIFLVLYPRPTALGESIYRLFQFPSSPPNVEHINYDMTMEIDPTTEAPAIERYILQQVPYMYDWQVYNLPWYFPTTSEALQKGMGDCKTRLVILVLTFESLGIPYEVYLSPSHIWIYYEGKKETRIENKEVTLLINDGENIRFQMPTVYWRHNFEAFWEAFWTHMPLDRKVSLLAGLSFSFLLSLTPTAHRRFPAS